MERTEPGRSANDFNQNNMRAISFWARNHKWSSRLLIVFVLYPLLNIIAFVFGDLLASMDIQLPPAWYYTSILIAIFIFIFYPTTGASYSLRKSMDCLLAVCTFCMVAVISNRADRAPSITVPMNEASASVPVKEVPARLKKDLRKSLKKFIHNYRKKYRRGDQGTKTFLIILTIVLAVGVFLLLGALACTVACNGAEVLALIILVAGGVGIFVGMAAVIRSINRKYPGQPKEKTAPVQEKSS